MSERESNPSTGERRRFADPEIKDDLLATVHARKDLGVDHEDALVEAFLDRIDRQIEARIDSMKPPPEDHDGAQRLAIATIALGIPLSAIAGGIGGVAGLAMTWAGIVVVNFLVAVSGRRGRSRR